MTRVHSHAAGHIVATVSMLFLLSGCIVTPRVEMTERIDFNYHAPAIAAPLSATDLMCSNV